jgi:hypothetical protein
MHLDIPTGRIWLPGSLLERYGPAAMDPRNELLVNGASLRKQGIS